MPARFSLVLVCLFCLLTFAQDSEDEGWELKFEDYAIKDTDSFHGTPAARRS